MAGQISGFPKTGCSILHDKVKVKRLPKLACLALLGVLTDKVRCNRMEGQLRWRLGRLLQSKYQLNVMDVVDGQGLPNRLCAVRSRRAVSLGRRNGAQMQQLFAGSVGSAHHYSSCSYFVCGDGRTERSSGASASGIGGHNAHGHAARHRASSSPQVRYLKRTGSNACAIGRVVTSLCI